MQDRAGSSLETARNLNFRDQNKGFPEFIGALDRTDITRFRASEGSVNITARGLSKRESVRLYFVERPLDRTLKQIGESEFRSLDQEQQDRFLERVPLSFTGGRKNRTFNAETSEGVYFLVVNSRAKNSKRYNLRFSANPEIDLGAVQGGQVGESDKRDEFQFTLERRQRVSFVLDGLTEEADLNLLAGDRSLLRSSTAAGTESESILRNLEKGTYYIQVRSNSDSETSYTLTTSATDPTQKQLHRANGRSRPGEEGELHHNRGSFSNDDTDRITRGLQVNGQSLSDSRREQVRGHLDDNYVQEGPTETVGTNGTRLRNRPNSSRPNSGFVGYTTHSPDYDNVSVDVDDNEAEEWHRTQTPPSTLQYNTDFNPVNQSNPTILDATVGYTVSFDVSIDDDPKDINDPGFTTIIVSNDGLSAIELGFTGNGIVAHSPTFTPEERVTPTFNMEAMNRYDVYIAENAGGTATYELFANGELILSGPTRQYIFDSASVTPPFPFNKYRTPNYLFFGTRGSRTNAEFTIGQISAFT